MFGWQQYHICCLTGKKALTLTYLEERYLFIFGVWKLKNFCSQNHKNVPFGVLMVVENGFVSICRTDSALRFSWFFLFYLVCDI
jgi:hypothetical protein